MQNVYLYIMGFYVSILGWAAKKTFPKNSQVHVIHGSDFVYSGEVAYMEKPSVAQMVMDTFFNEEDPFDTDFLTFEHKYLAPKGLSKEIYLDDYHRSKAGEDENRTFVFVDGSVLEVYCNVNGFCEPKVWMNREKTFFFNMKKGILEEDPVDYWIRKNPNWEEEEMTSWYRHHYGI